MKRSPRMSAVVALQLVVAMAMVLVYAAPSLTLVWWLMAMMAVIASGSLALAEYLSQRH